MSALLPTESTPKPSPKRTRSTRAAFVHDADGNLVGGEKIPPSPLTTSAAPRQKKRKRGPAPSKVQKESDFSSPPPTSSTASPVPDLGAQPPSIPSLEKTALATSPSPSSTIAPSPTIPTPVKEVEATASSPPQPTPPEPIPQLSEVPKAAEPMQMDPQVPKISKSASKDASNPSNPSPLQPESPSPLKINPHAFYFYQNGDLLIEVDGVHFKLFWDRIIKASTFFQEKYNSAKNDESKKALLTGNEVVVLTGMDVTVDELVVLLDMVESIKPPQTQTHRSLKSVLSILNASHTLSFHGHTDWAKEQLSTLWSVGDDFENLSSITTLSSQEVACSIALARKCDIPGIIKPAVFSLVRLPDFGGSGQTTSYSFDLVQCRERLLGHWVTTLNRLVLPICTSSPPSIPTDASTFPIPCTANDPVKSRFFHYKTIYETGFFQVYMNDAISGLQVLKEQLVPNAQPQMVPPPRKRRRKFSEEPEVKSVPDVGKWADPNVGGYCGSCVEKMWDICAEGMEECWDHLDEWAGVKSASFGLTRMDVS